MRRNIMPHVVAWGFLAIVSASPRVAAEECSSSPFCRSGPGDCEKADVVACTCKVTVLLTDPNGKCEVTAIQPEKAVVPHRSGLEAHHVRVCRKDTLVWEFKNYCHTGALTVKVDNFRADAVIEKEFPKATTDKPTPLDPPDCNREKRVESGLTEEVRCGIKPEAHHPRTYKYDIVWQGPSGAPGKLDPEIEIYK